MGGMVFIVKEKNYHYLDSKKSAWVMIITSDLSSGGGVMVSNLFYRLKRSYM